MAQETFLCLKCARTLTVKDEQGSATCDCCGAEYGLRWDRLEGFNGKRYVWLCEVIPYGLTAAP